MSTSSKKISDSYSKAKLVENLESSEFVVNQVGSQFQVIFHPISYDNVTDANKMADDLNKVIKPVITSAITKLDSDIQVIINA